MSVYDHNVQTVDAVADIKDVLPTDGQLVQTLGYYAAGDGGGNLYRYLAGPATCDGGLVLDGQGGDNTPAATNATYAGTGVGRYYAVNNKSIHREQFGMKLDGIYNDAFRLSALNAAGIQIIRPVLEVQVNSVLGVRTVTVTVPAAEVLKGYKAADFIGADILQLSLTDLDVGILKIESTTFDSLVFMLTGNPSENDGHQITAKFR